MKIDPSLRQFCFAQADVFVVPAEALSVEGVDPDFAMAVTEERRLSAPQIDCLSAGFALYYQRCAGLFQRAPETWFSPRATNLIVAANERGVLPYVEPFKATSSLLYASDLNTDPEYVAYLLLHMERLALVHSMSASLVLNLSYWFDRSEGERRAFARAAAGAKRPDAASFIALGKALRWVDEAFHNPLRPPRRAAQEPYIEVSDTGLYIPKRLESKLRTLCNAAEDAVRQAMRPPALAIPGSTHHELNEFCDWLERERAQAIILAPDKSIVWSPDAKDASAMRQVLADTSPAAIKSIRADVAVIDRRSRQFLGCVRDLDSLPRQCAVLEADGGTYIDPQRRAVVHELVQNGFDARNWEAPPYHRLLVGARVIHEWGHIAHTAKMIRVPPAAKPDYEQARAELGECFEGVLARVPPRLRHDVERESQFLAARSGDLRKGLARKTLARVGDYLSNLLCSRLIPVEEMQAYVRTNVHHHFDEDLGVVSALARYAYEVQYLGLAGLSRDYFFRTSRFPDYFINSGIISERDTHALFDAVGAVLAHYDFDDSLLDLRAAGAVH